MNGHTPGPWFHANCIASIPKTIDIGAEDNSNVAQVLTGANVESDATAWANARLIAAAPDLLEALHALVKANDLTDPALRRNTVQHAWPAARAAIAKTEGAQ